MEMVQLEIFKLHHVSNVASDIELNRSVCVQLGRFLRRVEDFSVLMLMEFQWRIQMWQRQNNHNCRLQNSRRHLEFRPGYTEKCYKIGKPE